MKNKRLAIAALIAALLIITITITLVVLIGSTPKKAKQNINRTTIEINSPIDSQEKNTIDTPQTLQNSEGVYIQNMSEYNNIISDETLKYVSQSLLYTLQLNNKPETVIPKVFIRKDTFSQNLIDTDRLVYETRFITDVPELKQSFDARILYSPLPPEDSGIRDYSILFNCIHDNSKLIYGEFNNCKDRITFERNGQ